MTPRRRASQPTPRPFLKWAGGKGQLLRELVPRVEKAAPFERYFEPFVGGGALFFELHRLGMLEGKKAVLSDVNERLITAYLAVQQDVEGLIARLRMHKKKHCKDHYYAVRENVPDSPLHRAARIIYLNKTCFNGLFRENSKGLFNVPMGDYADPIICDEANLRAASRALQDAALHVRPFDRVLDEAQPGDLVYFDPPYNPVSKTSSFTAYSQDGFGEEEQRRLAGLYAELTCLGVKAVLSNSYTDLVLDLYGDFHVSEVRATRALNSRADKRGAVSEALVVNFAA
jgi:DNA adenine methylase